MQKSYKLQNSKTKLTIGKLFLLIWTSNLLFSPSAYAHLRWFVEKSPSETQTSFIWDFSSFLIFLCNILFIATLIGLEKTSHYKYFKDLTERVNNTFSYESIWRLISRLTGIMLLGNGLTHTYLAPNIHINSNWFMIVGDILQITLGVTLLTNISIVIPALSILLVSVITLFIVPFSVIIDYLFEFVGLALALILIGPTLNERDKKIFAKFTKEINLFSGLALPILRVATGLTLITLGIHDKLIDPNLGLAFLEKNHLNIFAMMGFQSFTDLHFTLAAGVTEVVFGSLITLGIAVPLATTCLALFFVTTLFIFGPHELIGHAPLFGIAFMFILRGGAFYARKTVDLRERREALRFSLKHSKSVQFAFAPTKNLGSNLIDLSYAGLALQTDLRGDTLLSVTGKEFDGHLITPFSQSPCKIRVVDTKPGVMNCVFNDKFSQYLPYIHDLLAFSYQGQKYQRLAKADFNDSEIIFELNSDSTIKFTKNINELVNQLEIRHLIDGQEIHMLYDKDSSHILNMGGNHLTNSNLEKIYYLVMAVIETHQLPNASELLNGLLLKIRNQTPEVAVAS
jgi:uncharacterized membrane protein YphA (DoxX/SURF4 family)